MVCNFHKYGNLYVDFIANKVHVNWFISIMYLNESRDRKFFIICKYTLPRFKCHLIYFLVNYFFWTSNFSFFHLIKIVSCFTLFDFCIILLFYWSCQKCWWWRAAWWQWRTYDLCIKCTCVNRLAIVRYIFLLLFFVHVHYDYYHQCLCSFLLKLEIWPDCMNYLLIINLLLTS